MSRVIPKGAAQLVLWTRNVAQPVAFLVPQDQANLALEDYAAGTDTIKFTTWNDGSGIRNDSVFRVAELRGVAVEYNSIQIVGG